LPSEPGERYFCPPGYVVRDEVVMICLYAGSKKEKWIECRVTELSSKPGGERERD
jgi:hypothetical protein